MFDIVIIGGGPAGVAAGVYAARKRVKTLLLADAIGGQSSVSASIENWIGSVSVKGFEFSQMLDGHLRAQEGIEIRVPERVQSVAEGSGGRFVVKTEKGEYETKTVIIAAGGRHRHLGVPGEEKFVGKGVVYCSTCDAPFFKEKTVAVVGGGNSGLEACQDLFPYASKIFLLSRSAELSGDPLTQEEIQKHPKVEVLYHADTKEILGEEKVTGLRYANLETREEKTIALDGVFVEIGIVPNTEFVNDLIALNKYGEIVCDHRTMATSRAGVFAAGDATDGAFRQNNISAGQGVTAALSAYEFCKKQ